MAPSSKYSCSSMIVTIDGPAGTGKSTVARSVASQLGFEYLDTGAMYRVVALLMLQSGNPPENGQLAANMAQTAKIEFHGPRCFACGSDVTEEIRSTLVSETASIVAQHPGVRAALVEEQRRIASGCNIVCEGRDQGTIVFPLAEYKFFLTAPTAVRAGRRMTELQNASVAVTYESVLEQLEARDRRDAERAVAPLRPADDAIIIDTGELTPEEVTAEIVTRVRVP